MCNNVRYFFPKGFKFATFYQVFLARTIKLIDSFLKTDVDSTIEEHLFSSKEIIFAPHDF